MVLASASSTNLIYFAQLADKIVEVAMPLVSSVTTSNDLNSELQSIHSEIAKLKGMFKNNTASTKLLSQSQQTAQTVLPEPTSVS